MKRTMSNAISIFSDMILYFLISFLTFYAECGRQLYVSVYFVCVLYEYTFKMPARFVRTHTQANLILSTEYCVLFSFCFHFARRFLAFSIFSRLGLDEQR